MLGVLNSETGDIGVVSSRMKVDASDESTKLLRLESEVCSDVKEKCSCVLDLELVNKSEFACVVMVVAVADAAEVAAFVLLGAKVVMSEDMAITGVDVFFVSDVSTADEVVDCLGTGVSSVVVLTNKGKLLVAPIASKLDLSLSLLDIVSVEN